MPFQIRYEPRVDEDLEMIREFLEEFPDASPSKTLGEIVKEIGKLAKWPKSHPQFEDDPRLRKLSVGKYTVLYWVDEGREAIFVQHIFHQYRNITKALHRVPPTFAYEYEKEDENER